MPIHTSKKLLYFHFVHLILSCFSTFWLISASSENVFLIALAQSLPKEMINSYQFSIHDGTSIQSIVHTFLQTYSFLGKIKNLNLVVYNIGIFERVSRI